MEDRIAIARERYPRLELVAGDATSLPWPEQSFDLVTQFTCLSSVLDHDVRRAIAAEMWRVLAPGGAIVSYDARAPRGPIRAFRRLGALRAGARPDDSGGAGRDRRAEGVVSRRRAAPPVGGGRPRRSAPSWRGCGFRSGSRPAYRRCGSTSWLSRGSPASPRHRSGPRPARRRARRREKRSSVRSRAPDGSPRRPASQRRYSSRMARSIAAPSRGSAHSPAS